MIESRLRSVYLPGPAHRLQRRNNGIILGEICVFVIDSLVTQQAEGPLLERLAAFASLWHKRKTYIW